MDVIEQIERVYKFHPDRAAFVNQQNVLSYRELWQTSDVLASWLSDQGKEGNSEGKPGKPILVYGHMQREMLICFLACVKAGRAYIPLDSSMPLQRITQIAGNSGSDLMLSQTGFPKHTLPTNVRLLEFFGDNVPELANIRSRYGDLQLKPLFRVTQEQNFYVIYTSGSTGDPKGVQITHHNLVSFVCWMKDEFPFAKEDVVLNQAPFSFDLSIMGLYPALTSGATLWALDQALVSKPKGMFENLLSSGLTVWVSTPSFVEICLMEPAFAQAMLPRLRLFLFCGEVLPVGTVRKLLERFPEANIVNTYGPTEATVAVTSVRVDNDLLSRYPVLPVGRCKPDCRIRITDENGFIAKGGEKGEIVICGSSVGKGYLANEKLTETKFKSVHDHDLGPTRAYRTGDQGYVKDGFLFCSGRMDFQVKLHGYRIELEDIEHHLRELPEVKAAAVLPHWKDGACDYLTAFVAPTDMPDHIYDFTEVLKRLLAKRLPLYMIPRKFVCRASLPMNGNGKLDRRQLQQEEML